MTNHPRSGEAVPPGWLVARRDSAIVVADRALCDALGFAGPESLLGGAWTSLVAPVDAWRVAEARDAEAAGVPWSGVLALATAHGAERFAVELFPAGAAAEDVTVIRAAPLATPAPASPPALAAPPDDLAALLTATEAGEESIDAAAAARSVLQAVRTTLAFDWGIVVRFLDGPPAGAEVVATYPAGMAGMERGVRWAPLDDAERVLLESGEPALDGSLARRFHERSPLARLPAFGMRSRLQIPVFAGGQVRGCVTLYATRASAYAAADGIRLERFVRPLRTHFAAAPTRAPGAPLAPPAGVTRAVPHPPPPALPVATPPPPPSPAAPPHDVRQPAAAEPLERGRWEPGPRDRAELVARRLGALGEMVSGVAHELNNPLTAILGYAQILPTLDGADRDQALATIEQEALRASRIVRNLLAFARQHRTRTEPVDITAVLRRVIDVRRATLGEDHVVVETHFGDTPPVMGDPYQLEQVFLNLVNNAYQAMLPDGGTMTISTRVVGSGLRASVSDTGPGVPEEVADRIFEPFFTTRDVGAGAGLGLAIVYGIVAEHGGHVWVERSAAGGAEFVIELPRASEEQLATTAVPAPAPASTASPAAPSPAAPPMATPARPSVPPEHPAREVQRERILVVDDELPIRALTNEILSAAGYAVETAASGDEALRQLETGGYDAVVADMRLPMLEGDALFGVVEQRWPRLRNRVLFITGDPEADREAELLDARGARHLEKPFDTQTLLRAVRELLATATPSDRPRA